MSLDDVLNVVSLVLVIGGALLCLTAGIGLVRLRDVPSRLHAATKPQILGLILIAIAVALENRSWQSVALLTVMVLLQMATAPLAAHMVGRQAYRNGTLDYATLTQDDLAADVEAERIRQERSAER